MKTTDWYPGTVKPAYVGVYYRRCTFPDNAYSYFSEEIGWGAFCTTPEEAYALRNTASKWQELPWRGLTEPHCKKRGAGMVEGIAIAQMWTGSYDFPCAEIVTMSPGGSGWRIGCYKCPACGWSVTR